MQRFSADGLSVAINRPFSGALVPMHYFQNDRRVISVMVEVNRRLYLDEATGKMGSNFSHIQGVLARALETVQTQR
jgi:N-formylglutamate deformylase